MEELNTFLVIASNNLGKVDEFRHLLLDFPFTVLKQPDGLEIDESGGSFVENARIKAIEVSKKTGMWSLADDSGLCVEALNGRPGIYSARYGKNDHERINRLLKELATKKDRKANFVSALCVASNGYVLFEAEAFCQGAITYSPRGENGFGYDPIFEVSDTQQTYAEMTPERKLLLGHRGLAFKKLRTFLKLRDR